MVILGIVQDACEIAARHIKALELETEVQCLDLGCVFIQAMARICPEVRDVVHDWDGTEWRGEMWAEESMSLLLSDVPRIHKMVRRGGSYSLHDDVEEMLYLMLFRAMCWNRLHTLVDSGGIKYIYWGQSIACI